ncbi:hypothetical protein ACJJTC_014163 [Scirpophaga incertulas]
MFVCRKFLIIPCILLFVYAWRRRRKYLQGLLPPVCGYSWPIVGLAHMWINGSLCDPVDSTVIGSSFSEKAYLLEEPVEELFGNSLMMTPSWQKRRVVLEPVFDQLCSQLDVVNQQSTDMVKELAENIEDDSFNWSSSIRNMVIKTMFATTFCATNENFAKYIDLFKQAIDDITDTLFSIHSNVFMHNKVLYNFSKLKRRHHNGTLALNNMTDEIVIQKKASLKSKLDNSDDQKKTVDTDKTLLDYLLELEELGVYPEEDIVKELIAMIFSGYATISNTVECCLHLLGSHLEVQQKLKKEIYEMYNGSKRNVSINDLKELVYLEAALMETLRLCPPVSMVTRVVDKEVQLRKYKLEAGSKCLLGIYGINRNEVWGSDKNHFKLERWLNTGSKIPYLASYGFGERSCIGKQLSLNILKVILVHILREYDVSTNGKVLKLKQELFVGPASQHIVHQRASYSQAENV